MHAESFLFGVSDDGGKKWTFIDTAKLTPENVHQIVPIYDARLKLPKKKEPVLVRK